MASTPFHRQAEGPTLPQPFPQAGFRSEVRPGERLRSDGHRCQTQDAHEHLLRLPPDGWENDKPIVREVRVGAAFMEIIDYARGNEIDLIVIGTHGRSGLMHILMGSVAERIVRKSPCPVLTVKPEGHQFVMP